VGTRSPNTTKAQEAREKFEEGVAKLFKAKKTFAKEPPKTTPKRKQGKTSKG
jgi:hypothetical protein